MKKIIGVIIALIVIIGIVYYNSYSTVRTFDLNGYVFTSDNITNILVNGKDVSSGKVEFSKIKYDENLYKGKGKYFIGDRKKVSVNLDYPIVSTDNKTLLLLSDKGKLVDDGFRKTDMYANTLVSDNKLFNETDYERADKTDYIFIELDNTIFVNLSKINIEVMNRKYNIPVNSFISFSEESLRYYYLSSGKYYYEEISGLSETATVTMDDRKFSYSDLLEKLGLFVKEEQEEPVVKPSPSPSPSPEEVKEEKKTEKPKTKEEKKDIIVDGEVYVKPTVTFDNPKGNIYSFTGKLEIEDPASRIVKYPTFEFYKGDTLVVRKTFVNSDTIEVKGIYPSTEYNVVGYFNYKNEKNQEVKAKFTEFTFSTKDISGLEKLNFNIDEVVPYFNYAEFKGIGFNNSINDEVLKGVKKVVLNVGNSKYQLSTAFLTKMLKLEKQDYATSKSLTSNTNYNISVEVYDVSNNRLELSFDGYNFKTTRQAPTGTLAVKSKDINKASLKFNIDNKDDVNISNMHVVVYDSSKNIVKDQRISGLDVDLDDLDSNEVYTVYLYGDYDLEDGQGIQKNKVIVDGKFTTEPISVLGYVRLDFSDITSGVDDIKATVNINSETNQKLLSLLSDIQIKLRDNETDEVVTTINFTTEEFENLINGGSQTIHISRLESNHKYYFDNYSYAVLGTKTYDIKTITNTGKIQTKKKDAEVQIINKMVTENMIDFDVRIKDYDGAIETERCLFEVRDRNGVLVHYDELSINGDYVRVTLEKLNKNEYYDFSYKVEEYNIGDTNATFETDKTLFNEKILTQVGLSGSVEIDSLLKQITSKNLFDIRNNRRWLSQGNRDPDSRKINTTDNIISLGAKNGYRSYSYYLPEYANQWVTVSFKIKYKDSRQKPVYIGATTGNFTTKRIDGITSDDWLYYTYTVQISSYPYIGFNIREDDGYNETTTILIKDLQIELGKTATDYVPYKEKANYMGTFVTNLEDRNSEIPEDDFYYYLRYYKNDKLIDTVKFDMNDERKVVNEISKHEIEPAADYNIKLSIRKRIVDADGDAGYRYYDLDNLNFASDDEIRTIKTVQDFYAMHTSGFYLVAADLDFTDQTGTIGSDINRFNGIIDFQGHKVIKTMNKNNGSRAGSYLFHTVGSNGLIKNVDLHYYFNGAAVDDWPGFVYYQYGIIENVNVVLEQGNNANNTRLSMIARNNYGTIRNFVINLKDKFTTMRQSGLVCHYNTGNIINGYMYGQNIDASKENTSLSGKYVGGLMYQADGNSYVANIYSLVGIDIGEGQSTRPYQREVGNLIAYVSRTIIRNCYVTTGGKNRNTSDYDINFAYRSSAFNGYNIFYSANETYPNGTTNSSKIAPNTLRSKSFQNILNADNAFDIDGYVTYGYYPHIIWPDVMPNQEYVKIPIVESGEIDFLNVESYEDLGNERIEATLLFQNPGYEDITELIFNDISVDFDVTKQENEDGKSKVKVLFHTPLKYASKYSLSRIGYMDSSYTTHYRSYNANERTAEIDMYMDVYNRSDFDVMKTKTTQNFRLQTDLNFENNPFNLSEFKGKLDGNGHTLKNIKINNTYFIYSLNNGTIKNLFVDGLLQEGVYDSSYGGLICRVVGNSTIDNVHISNVSITDGTSTRQRGATYIGGFIGYADNSLINNSSVSDVHIYETNTNNFRNNGYYGGFIGYMTSTIVQNCFVSDANIEIKTALKTFGIGGFIGRLGSGYVRDCYATGIIDTNQSEVGGLVGYNSGYLERSISLVDVYSQQDTIGGIVGYSTNQYIYNTLSLGAVYSSKDATFENRTIGNKAAINSNYAWSEQLVSGLNTNTANGDILLTTEELQSATTYENLIKLGKQFDLSNLVNDSGHNLIPKLKMLSKDTLVPGQKDEEYYVDDFNITNVTIRKSETDATIQIRINNPGNYEVSDLEIDGLKIRNVNKNVTEDGETLYEVYVTPERYYDSYLVKSITYLKGDKEVIRRPGYKLKVMFYKDIGTFEDWQKIDSTIYENYRLVQDIDFSGKTNVKTRISVNRLEGTDGGHTISNISINVSDTSQYVGLFDTVACNISNVTFDHITITTTSSRDFTGVIRFLNGTMSDVNFTNINISANGSNVGCVASNSSIDIKRINLDHVTVSGASRVGGFIGTTRYFDIAHIYGKNMNVTGSSSYVGGLLGFMEESLSYPTMFNFYIEDSTVKGGSETGGIFGRGACSYSVVKNVNVTGTSLTGGYAGRSYFTYITDVYVVDSTINGTSSVGGICGYTYGLSRAWADNVTINAGSYVGGIVGEGYGYGYDYTGVSNSRIVATGDYVGGIRGYTNYMTDYSYVFNTEVTGRNIVGGLLGWHAGSGVYVRRCISNATVTATGDEAGGIVGKLNNSNTNANDNRIFIYDNIIAGSEITSNGVNAGAISGSTQTFPFEGHFYSNYLEAYVHNKRDTKYGFFLGNDTSDFINTSLLRSLKVFKGSTINGTSINNVSGLPSNVSLHDRSALTSSSFYTSLFNVTGVSYDYSELANGKYPFINNYYRGEGEYYGKGVQKFDLPAVAGGTYASTFSTTSMMSTTGRTLVSNLPEVKVYACDVDKINVEFSKVDNNVSFTINNVKRTIEQLTYTYYYDYNEDFTILLSDGINSKTITIKADDLRNHSSVDGDDYYFLDGEKIISNDNSSLENMSNDNVQFRVEKLSNTSTVPVNIYDNKILLSDKNIYDIDKKKVIDNSFENLTLTNEKSLYKSNYGNNTIETYYNYSIVNDKVVSKQVFAKDDTLEVIDSTLNNKKDSVLVGNSNGKEYLVYLGTDGKLYSVKNNIKFPKNFINSNIKSISTDMYNDSDIVFVLYNNYNYVVFNYKTGDIIKQSMNKDSSISNYFKSFVSSGSLNNKKLDDYNNSITLMGKLKKKSVSEVLGKEAKSDFVEQNYTSVYNPVTDKYEIYEVPNSVDNNTDLDEALSKSSVSNSISNNPVLYRYYVGNTRFNQDIFVRISLLMICIMSGILIAMVLLRKNLKNEA